jgi:hypothetical protein
MCTQRSLSDASFACWGSKCVTHQDTYYTPRHQGVHLLVAEIQSKLGDTVLTDNAVRCKQRSVLGVSLVRRGSKGVTNQVTHCKSGGWGLHLLIAEYSQHKVTQSWSRMPSGAGKGLYLVYHSCVDAQHAWDDKTHTTNQGTKVCTCWLHRNTVNSAGIA